MPPRIGGAIETSSEGVGWANEIHDGGHDIGWEQRIEDVGDRIGRGVGGRT